jgi:predicted RNA-binding protein with PIN domain
MDSKESTESKIWTEMISLWQKLEQAKPNGRSEQARRYAVAITEYQKVMGYFYTFVMQECSLDHKSE